MAYQKTFWKDRIRDSQGNIIQEGTPVSAGHLNNMEDGIAAAHDQLAEQAKETVSLPYGLSVLNSPDGSPLDVEMQGQTLISLGNSELEGGKKYVLADPQYGVIVDGTTYRGVAKFEGKNTKPTIIRTTNFKDKIAGSNANNPHNIKYAYQVSSLQAPTSSSFFEPEQNHIDYVKALDGTVYGVNTEASSNGFRAQQLFCFNILEEVERNIGKIPKESMNEKVQWLKDNIEEVSFNWWGYGSSSKGYRADIVPWNDVLSSWTTPWSGHSVSSPAKMPVILYGINLTSGINNQGEIYFLAYAEESDSTTKSTIYTDYTDLDIKLKASATLTTSRVPLYEVSQMEYDKILTDWDATSVANRYPAVEGIQSLQNPIVTVESENLLPSFMEMNLHNNAIAEEAYKLVLNATGSTQNSSVNVKIIPNMTYCLSIEEQEIVYYVILDENKNVLFENGETQSAVFTTPPNSDSVDIIFSNHAKGPGTYTFSEAMLSLGNNVKSFVPRNPSHLYAETTLRGLNNINDLLYQEDGQWKIMKKWEQIVLDGSQQYVFDKDSQGFKGVMMALSNSLYNQAKLINEQGKEMKLVSWGSSPSGGDSFAVGDDHVFINIYDYESGWAEEYTPTVQEMKDFFVNHPYTLIYQLASPQIIDITNKVEGSLSVSGQTQISVDSGVVVREKTKLYYDADSKAYRINFLPDSNSWLARSTNNIIAIYKNNVLDTRWDIVSNHSLGKGGAFASLNELYFDENSDYHVTYLALEKEAVTANTVNVLATYNTSIRSTVNQMNEQLADVKTLASVHDRYLYKLILAAKANGWSV